MAAFVMFQALSDADLAKIKGKRSAEALLIVCAES